MHLEDDGDLTVQDGRGCIVHRLCGEDEERQMRLRSKGTLV